MIEEIKTSFGRTKTKLPFFSKDLLFSGLYCFYLSNSGNLFDFAKPNEIIYIGKADDSLICRLFCQHISTNRTNQSTLRRSLGAIFKDTFALKAKPGSKTKSPKSIRRYKFEKTGELKLSEWIEKNLEFGYYVNNLIESNKIYENDLIKELKPILNTQKNPRSDEPFKRLKKLKKICRDEASNFQS